MARRRHPPQWKAIVVWLLYAIVTLLALLACVIVVVALLFRS
jgi:uncharacterized protein (DUF983 family)